jgi:hypothetical protein
LEDSKVRPVQIYEDKSVIMNFLVKY